MRGERDWIWNTPPREDGTYHENSVLWSLLMDLRDELKTITGVLRSIECRVAEKRVPRVTKRRAAQVLARARVRKSRRALEGGGK